VNRKNSTEHTQAIGGPFHGGALVIDREQAKNKGIPTSPDMRSDTASDTRIMLLRVRKLSFQYINATTMPLNANISKQRTIKGPWIGQENLPSQGKRT